jgi:hypothetical protein
MRLLSGLGLLLAALVAACASSPSSAGGGTCGGATGAPSTVAPGDIDRTVAALSGAFCDAMGECCGTASLPYSRGACEASVQQVVRGALQRFGGRAVLHEESLARCAGYLRRRERACTAAADWDLRMLDADGVAACSVVFEGSRAPGESCATARDCAGVGAICAYASTHSGCYTARCLAAGPPTTCLPAPDAPACALGTHCGTNVHVCMPERKLGEACRTTDDVCEPGGVCPFDPKTSPMAVCVPAPKAGERCQGFTQLCGPGLVCADGTCTPPPEDDRDSLFTISPRTCSGGPTAGTSGALGAIGALSGL